MSNDKKEETSKPAADEEVDEDDEEDLEKLQAEIERMEAEAARIAKETEALEQKKQKAESASGTAGSNDKDEAARESCSIYVGQVDYSTTPEELLAHFEGCGTVERVTIVCDKFTGKPKGFAYLEFQNEAAVDIAMKLDGSEFKGRNLKVTPKRVNVPGFSAPRGGMRGARGGRVGYRGGAVRGGRGRRAFRGGRGGYHPYY